GLVTLLLLTASVVLGIVQVLRWSPPGSPRFVIVTLHRAISLLVVALLSVHVATAVLDRFAPIRLVDAVLPFPCPYRPLWLALGCAAPPSRSRWRRWRRWRSGSRAGPSRKVGRAGRAPRARCWPRAARGARARRPSRPRSPGASRPACADACDRGRAPTARR